MNSTAIEARNRRMKGSIAALAVLTGLALGTSSVYKGCKVNEELEPLRNRFEDIAYLQEPTRHAGLYRAEGNFLDYNGNLDSIIDQRDQMVNAENCIGFGSWDVMEQSVGNLGVKFFYTPICLPF